MLGDCARTLPHLAGGEIFQRRTQDAGQIVAAVPVKFRVLHGDDGIDQVARQLVVRHSLPVFDVDLPKDLAVSIEDHTGRFHLFELAQVEGRGPAFDLGDKDQSVDSESADQHDPNGDRDIKLRRDVPRAPETVARRRSQILRLSL